MSNLKFTFLLLLTIIASSVKALDIIPYPSSLIETKELFSFKKTNTIYYSGNLKNEAKVLADMLSKDFTIHADVKNGNGNTGIILNLNAKRQADLGDEGYTLEVRQDAIEITAANQTGIFYGIQTLKQILDKSPSDHRTVKGVKIMDKPRFPWRAFMLDEGRYFKGEQAVKDVLDEMARLKLNTFHWHLTDDAGWRIEIKKYPLLTEIGSKRDSSQVGVWPSGWASKEYDGKPHEGFYTQKQVREIIKYAADRHITIIPEIEMPGHSSAAIASYPWLGVKDSVIKVPGTFGVQYDVFNIADERVRNFLKNVLVEVMDLFPSNVIHIGGDEVRYDHWRDSKLVNDFMKQNNIASYAELQVWFTNEISQFVESKGRRMMGWNEIMGTQLHEYSNSDHSLIKKPLAKNTIVHFWKGDLDLINDAVKKGHSIVNAYHEFTYLDYDLNKIPLSKSYSFDPIPENLAPEFHGKILGLGSQMWGEWTPTVESMNKLMYPRLAAYAEVGWTPVENKDYDRFLRAVQSFY